MNLLQFVRVLSRNFHLMGISISENLKILVQYDFLLHQQLLCFYVALSYNFLEHS